MISTQSIAPWLVKVRLVYCTTRRGCANNNIDDNNDDNRDDEVAWVGQLFWQGASAHFRQRAASLRAPRSLRVVCLMSSKFLYRGLGGRIFQNIFTNINYPTITYQTRFQKRGQQLSISLNRKPARVAFEVLCFVLVPFPVLFRLKNIFSWDSFLCWYINGQLITILFHGWMSPTHGNCIHFLQPFVVCTWKDKREGNFAVRGMDKDLSLPFLSKRKA